MLFWNYFDKVGEAIEFLMAVGSILGMFTLIFGMILFIFGSTSLRLKLLKIFVVAVIVLIACGPFTGIKYFRII